MSNGADEGGVSRLAYVYRIVLGLGLLGFTIYAAVALGAYLGGLILESNVQSVLGVPIEWGITGIGLSYILASIEKIGRTLKTLADFIAKGGGTNSLFADCMTVVGVVAYLATLATVFRFAPPVAPPPPPLVAPEPVFLVRSTPPTLPANEPLAVFPFLLELASGPPDWDQGIALSAQQEDDLSKLVRTLEACVGDAPGKDVVVSFRGFADTNEFRRDSEELNLQTANKRAEALHAALVGRLQAADGPSRVLVQQPRQWASFAEMVAARTYLSRPFAETGRSKDQGLFNRRAEVLLMNAGACEMMKRV